MFNQPTKDQLVKVPGFYETEDIPLKEKEIYLHFYYGTSDWYIAEYDGDNTFFGFVILNGDLEMAEWGNISFDELKSININGMQIENDFHWKVKKAIEIEDICKASNWV